MSPRPLLSLAFILCVALPAPALAQTAPGADVAVEARLALRTGSYERAASLARSRVETDADDAEAWLMLARSEAALGRIDAAHRAYARVRHADGRQRLDAEVESARLTRLHGDGGSRASARAVLERVLELHAGGGSRLLPVELVALGHAVRDLARFDASRYQQALDIYESALAAPGASPADRVRAHVAIASLLRDRYNNAEAVDALRDALELDDEHPEALMGIALSQHFDGALAAADAVARVLAVNRNHVAALSLRATLQIESEDYGRAAATIDRALAVNPRAAQPLTLHAALAFLDGDDAEFQVRVARVREQAPGHDALYETLAEVAAQNRRYARAAEFALLAVTLNPQSWRGHALLGVNRMRVGDMDNARSSLERAFAGDPFDPFTKNSLELLDRVDGFETVPSPRFVLVADRREAKILAKRLLPIAEQAYDAFAEAYDHWLPTPVRIELYPRHEDLSVRTVGLTGIDIVGVSFGPVVAMDSPSAGVFGPLNFGSVLWHELAHSFHLGLTFAKVPRWFTEGLATYEERRARPGWGFDLSPSFIEAYRKGELPKPSELNTTFLRPSGPNALQHGYYLSSLLMELIDREHGFEAIVGMLAGYAENKSTDELVREVLGREPEDLDAAFAAFMADRLEHAVRALAGDAAPDEEPDGPYRRAMTQAREAFEEKRFDDARTLLESAQKLLPELAGEAGTYVALARVHEERGDLRAAIEQLERNIAIDADDIESHLRLSALHEKVGDLEAAAATLDASMLIAPFDVEAQARLAAMNERLARWPAAIAARSAVVALTETDEAGARFRLARAQHRAGEFAAARKEVLRALELAPMFDDALSLLLAIREQGGAQ